MLEIVLTSFDNFCFFFTWPFPLAPLLCAEEFCNSCKYLVILGIELFFLHPMFVQDHKNSAAEHSSYPHAGKQGNCCPSQSSEMCRGFCFTGIGRFCRGPPGGAFFWALFPTTARRINPVAKIHKKSRGSKTKVREKKSPLPKPLTIETGIPW